MKKILFVVGALLTGSTFAENIPLPPTLNDVATYEACAAHAQKMQAWEDQGTLSNDYYNSVWYQGFGTKMTVTNYKQSCTNGACISYYGVNDKGYGTLTGCTIAGTLSDSAKMSLFTYLMGAYDLAISHQPISHVYHNNAFALYGEASRCTSANNYLGCDLYYK